MEIFSWNIQNNALDKNKNNFFFRHEYTYKTKSGDIWNADFF